MGVNVLIFLVFQFGFEPWRRRRLVRGFEEKVREALDKEKERQKGTDGQDNTSEGAVEDEKALDGIVAAAMPELESECDGSTQNQEPVTNALAAVIEHDTGAVGEKSEMQERPRVPTMIDYLRRSDIWKAGVLDLFSDRTVSLKKKDVTITALGGAATGVAIGSLIMFVLRPS